MVALICMLAAAGFGGIAERLLPSVKVDAPGFGLGKVLDFLPYLLGGGLASCFSQVSPKGALTFVIIHSMILVMTAAILRFVSTSAEMQALLVGLSPTQLVCSGRILMIFLTFILLIAFTTVLSVIHL